MFKITGHGCAMLDMGDEFLYWALARITEESLVNPTVTVARMSLSAVDSHILGP